MVSSKAAWRGLTVLKGTGSHCEGALGSALERTEWRQVSLTVAFSGLIWNLPKITLLRVNSGAPLLCNSLFNDSTGLLDSM